MYIITIMFKDNTTHSITTPYGENLFNLLWTFETSDVITAFRVCDGSGVINQESFHYGEMKKWVVKFNYGRDNNVLD